MNCSWPQGFWSSFGGRVFIPQGEVLLTLYTKKKLTSEGLYGKLLDRTRRAD